MEISELLVALTTPLLSGTASSNGSRNSGSGGCGSNKSGSDGGRDGGPTVGQNEKPDEKDEDAAEGRAEGCKKHQGKRQTVEQPLWRPVSGLVEQETATVDAGGNGRPDLDPGEKETEKGVGKGIDDPGTTQVATTSNNTAGLSAADGMAVLRRTGSARTTGKATFAARDAASTADLSPGSQGVEVHLHRRSAETQQRAQRLRVCRTKKQQEVESSAAQKIGTKSGLHCDSLDAPLRTARCSRAQQSPSSNLAPEREAATEKEAAAGVTVWVAEGRKRATRISGNGITCEAAQVLDQQKLDCHDKVNGQQREEEEQQKTSSSVSPTSVTTEQSPKVQQSEHHCQLQQQIAGEQSQDARWQAEQQERQQEKQQEQQQKRKQTDDISDREGARARVAEEEVGMKERCGMLVRGTAVSRGTAEVDERGAVECMPMGGGKDNQHSACDAPAALQQERQLLLEELEQLQKAGCPSEDSTGSPSKRTSFEDAVEGAIGSEKEQNSRGPPQGLQWHRRQEEGKAQVAQQCSSKEEGDGHIEDELKKSVTAVLAVALRGKAGRETRNQGNASYPLSPASGETSCEGFTTSSFETAASSQSQSPLNLQKEEAAEGTRCGTTNNSSTCSATNNNSYISDTPATNQHSNSAAPEETNVHLSNRSSHSLTRRCSATHVSAPVDSNTRATVSASVPGNRSVSDREDICNRSSSWDNNALFCGDRSSGDSGVSRRRGGSNAGGCDGRGVYETSRVSGSSSSTPRVSNAVRAQDSGLSSSGASGNNLVSGSAAACVGTLLKSSDILLKDSTVSQDAGSTECAVDRTSTIVGAAVLQDCFLSVKDLEQHAARVLLVPSAQTGGAKRQVLLPSLLLQKTTLGDEGRLTECSLWGGKREKLDTLTAARTAEALLSCASSAVGLYQSTLNEATVGEIRKDPAGMVLLPPVPDGNVDLSAANAGACGLLQQQLTSNLFTAGGGQPLLATGTVGPAPPGAPAIVGTETAAGALEQSLSQMWMLQQRSGCLGAPLSPSAPSSIQLSSPLPAAFPWPSPGAAANIGAVTSVVRTPAATAVAAAALLPRSFRSRSDYLSLCSLQGCPATQENERKPRTLEELRQLPSEEYISLQEMHLLAESLVSEFMKLQQSSLDSFRSSRSTACMRRQGNAQKNTKEDDECGISVTGSAATVVQRAEPLILHYRRDNLSFSVTPASSFTPFPSSVFEGTKKKIHPRNGGGSRAGLAVRDNMDEMEEEKKETLLGARYFTPSDFHINSSCPPASFDRTITRRENAARGHTRKNSPGDGARASTAKGTNAEEFFLPHATTHLFRARCQQAGTETGISDSTIGAVDRAFAEATTSFFRETQRQNDRCAFFGNGTVEAGLDEHGGKQQRICSSGKGTTEEPRVDVRKADVRAPSTRTGGNPSRSYQRLVPGSNSGADWRQGRVN